MTDFFMRWRAAVRSHKCFRHFWRFFWCCVRRFCSDSTKFDWVKESFSLLLFASDSAAWKYASYLSFLKQRPCLTFSSVCLSLIIRTYTEDTKFILGDSVEVQALLPIDLNDYFLTEEPKMIWKLNWHRFRATAHLHQFLISFKSGSIQWVFITVGPFAFIRCRFFRLHTHKPTQSKLQPELVPFIIFSSEALTATRCLSVCLPVCQIFNFAQSFFFLPSRFFNFHSTGFGALLFFAFAFFVNYAPHTLDTICWG